MKWLFILVIASSSYAENISSSHVGTSGKDISEGTLGHITLELTARRYGLDEALKKTEVGLPDPVRIKLEGAHLYKSEKRTETPYYERAFLWLPPKNDIRKTSEIYADCRGADEIEKALNNAFERGDEKIAIDRILPKFAARAGTKANCDGPNCWNATLNFHGLTNVIEHTSGYRMDLRIRDDYRQLGKGDKLRPGDAVAVYRGEYVQHTAVYVGGDVFFQKRSRLQEHPYAFETFSGLTRPYFDDIECHTELKIVFLRPKTCPSEKR